jgi:hypothetical protein
MGYLKGCFSSLCGLRLYVDHPDHIKFVSLWVIVCMAIRNFVIMAECTDNFLTDEFFKDRLAIIR